MPPHRMPPMAMTSPRESSATLCAQAMKHPVNCSGMIRETTRATQSCGGMPFAKQPHWRSQVLLFLAECLYGFPF
ncbi:MAG: hypothetical protein PHU14_14300 [Methylovulum sp.]|nr:hypothetical protein [Methylovulum sp.]